MFSVNRFTDLVAVHSGIVFSIKDTLIGDFVCLFELNRVCCVCVCVCVCDGEVYMQSDKHADKICVCVCVCVCVFSQTGQTKAVCPHTH